MSSRPGGPSRSATESQCQSGTRMCDFDLVKELGCHKCYMELLNEECVSVGEVQLESAMVSAESWTAEQRAEAAAAAAAEKERLAVVEEVQSALK
ncbi:hypothetical protein BG006_002708, partial [Podila minutissima]